MENAQLSLTEIYRENCKSKNYEDAFFCLQKIVNELQVDQQLGFYQQELGDMYLKGKVVTEDIEQAVYWYTKATKNNYDLLRRYSSALGTSNLDECNEIWLIANKTAEIGYSNAELFLGLLYLGSLNPKNETSVSSAKIDNYWLKIIEEFNSSLLNVEQNYEKSFFWLNKAANQGLAQAQAALGYMYLQGFFVEQNFEEAVNWYRKAAEQNDFDAQTSLVLMYFHGQGIEQDVKQAISWIEKADGNGNPESQYIFAQIYASEEDEDNFLHWCHKAAEKNHIQSQMDIAAYYESLDGEESKKQAFSWYKRAAAQGLPEAQLELCFIYQEGKGVEKSYEQAFFWCQKSAEQDFDQAQCYLGDMYLNGLGVEQSYEKATFWWLKAAEQGHAMAQNQLGWSYARGKGVEQDSELAKFWCLKAAENGELEGFKSLGEMYELGLGVDKDNEQAEFWFNKAREH